MKMHNEGYRALAITITLLLISGYDYSLPPSISDTAVY